MLAPTVLPVARGEIVAQTLAPAAGIPHLLRGIDVELVGGSGKDDRPDVAALDGQGTEPGVVALPGHESLAHLGHARHRRNAVVHRPRDETFARIDAVTWSVVGAGVEATDPAAVAAHLRGLAIGCGVRGGEGTVTINGVDPGEGLVSRAVNDSVSPVARVPEVRETLVARQRDYARLGSLVMEGRDIGTVVFPGTPYKFYIDASEEVRNARRRGQGLRDDLAARDRQDRSREHSPLAVAADATVIDSSRLTIDGVVEAVLASMREKGFVPANTNQARNPSEHPCDSGTD